MEAGTNFGIFDDLQPPSHRLSSTNHLVTLLQNAGISWKTYQENVTPGRATNSVFPYLARHNPFVFFDDVTSDLTYCTNHVRPFTDLAGDLTNGTVASYNFITPNQTNDMHDLATGSNSRPRQGDTWLSQQLPMILSSPAYTNNGAVFITWDEGNPDGPIGMMVLSPTAKGGGYSNSIRYNHSSLLRSLQEIFQVRPFLGAAAFANTLSDLFIGLTLTPAWTNGVFTVSISNSVPGKTNYLQASSDLVNWSTIRTNAGGPTVTIADPAATTKTSRFYRVLQLP
jgi:acid phosphatase